MTARPILVLGAECSGATLLAELLARWGARPAGAAGGAAETLVADIVEAMGGVLWSPATAGRAAALAAEPGPLRERAAALIAALSAAGTGAPAAAGSGGADDGVPWVWAAPFPALLLPFWERFLEAPVLVVPVRNPLDGAASFARRRLPPRTARQVRLAAYFGFRWQAANLILLETCRRLPDHLFVDCEQVLRSPFEQVQRLARFLDTAVGGGGGEEERLLPMLEAMELGLWHGHGGSGFLDLPQVTPAQKELLLHLRRRAADAAEPLAAELDLVPAYAWEYLHNFEVYLAQERQKAAAMEPAAAAH